MKPTVKLNLVGVVIPFCLMEFKNTLSRLCPGDTMMVTIQDPSVVRDIHRLLERSDDRLKESWSKNDRIHLLVERGPESTKPKEEA